MRLGTAMRSGLLILGFAVVGLAMPASASSNLSFRWTSYDHDGSSRVITFGGYSSSTLSLFSPKLSHRDDKKDSIFGKIETLYGNTVIGHSSLSHKLSLKQFKLHHSFFTKKREYCPPRGDAPIPEPSAALLFAVGGGVVALRVRKPRVSA
jgi:hypothetical protein